MDWKQAVEEDRAVLCRIVALLHALAGLAALAAGRSAVVRAVVLWVLRHAEAVARDFVAGDLDPQPASMPILAPGSGPADAVRLAASLRALARQIDVQARLALAERRQDDGEAGPPCSGRTPAIRSVLDALSAIAAAAFAAHRVPAPDTS